MLFRKGQAHDYIGQYDSVQAHTDQPATFDDALAQAHGALLAGRVHLRRRAYDYAVTAFETALEKYEAARGLTGQAMALDNLGIVHRRQDDLATALAFYERALAIKEKLEDERGMATALNSL
ncbi:MAG TPA: tetratricopeptide repeat protein [Rhodothermales bacterium]|nr:tetratricopeptide repeat protein [Rhodothermales bacterium]